MHIAGLLYLDWFVSNQICKYINKNPKTLRAMVVWYVCIISIVDSICYIMKFPETFFSIFQAFILFRGLETL